MSRLLATFFVYYTMASISTRDQWLWLRSIFPLSDSVSIKDTPMGNGLIVEEVYKGVPLFRYVRYFDGNRSTHVNLLGFVGITLSKSRRCILTEGVSDFLSVYSHTNPLHFSVLGRTSLNLSAVHADMLAALYDEVIVIGDNDFTGTKVFHSHLSLLSARGVRVRMVVPTRKDITTDLYFKDMTCLLSI